MIKSEPRLIRASELPKPYTQKVALICECTYFAPEGTFGHIVDRDIACVEGYECTKCGQKMMYGYGR